MLQPTPLGLKDIGPREPFSHCLLAVKCPKYFPVNYKNSKVTDDLLTLSFSTAVTLCQLYVFHTCISIFIATFMFNNSLNLPFTVLIFIS